MYRLSQKAGMKMDIFRCDGDKGMAGLPHQHGCAKHKFETFRRPRKIDGIQQIACTPGRAPSKGNHPGLSMYLAACREMTEGPKIFLLGELIREHGHSSNQELFKDELYRSMKEIDLVQSVQLGKEPLGELTNNTVEGGNSRLQTEGLKDLPPVDFFNQIHAMERDYWTRELEACLAWIKKTVRFNTFFLTLYHAIFIAIFIVPFVAIFIVDYVYLFFCRNFYRSFCSCCFVSTMFLLWTKGDQGISETVTHEISRHVVKGRANWTIRTHPPGTLNSSFLPAFLPYNGPFILHFFPSNLWCLPSFPSSGLPFFLSLPSFTAFFNELPCMYTYVCNNDMPLCSEAHHAFPHLATSFSS